PVVIVGIAAAAHQSWSANIFSTVGDMFPKSMIATITGIGGMAGGIGSFCIQLGAGNLFDYAESSSLSFMGYSGIEAGYMIAFSFCAVAYLASWLAMKSFVPKYMPIKL
ncbi:MAG: MFS transporter, partial [Alistipes sp.]|nr:MFS transporter [Alistipes sp.]